jgi:mannose-6-phosphate isomerase
MAILPLQNEIMNYAWGSHEALARLQSRAAPSALPEAELWMGTHPKAPSLVDGRPLQSIIESDPIGVLGQASAAVHGHRLPYLLKLLAAAKPLSIQAHPNLEQAQAGFTGEVAAGIEMKDPARCFRDSNHKPEVVYALSDFWALNGFRTVNEIMSLIELAQLKAIATETSNLKADGRLDHFFQAVMNLDSLKQSRLNSQLVIAASGSLAGLPEGNWLQRIDKEFPGDLGLLSVLMLNLVHLSPGHIMACQAGTLHAYLDGFCVELMANSDNVLRGGLTAKHVDIDELSKILTFSPSTPEVRPLGECAYESPTGEFRLEVVDAKNTWNAPVHHGCDIVVVIEGSGSITVPKNGEALELAGGEACVITADTGAYFLDGPMTVARASVSGGVT